jgi:hypothetical protein
MATSKAELSVDGKTITVENDNTPHRAATRPANASSTGTAVVALSWRRVEAA